MEIEYIDGFPQPYPLMDAEPYWQAAERGELTYQCCNACDKPVWPARSHCPECGRPGLEWKQSKGRGTVYSFSTVGRGPTPAWQAIAPYTVGFVELDEGYFLFTQIDANHDDIKIGQNVKVTFVKRGKQTIPVFRFVE